MGLVTVAIITSVISGGYYLRLIKEVVLRDREKGEQEAKLESTLIKKTDRRGTLQGGSINWVISVTTLITVLYGVNPRLVMVPISLMVTEVWV